MVSDFTYILPVGFYNFRDRFISTGHDFRIGTPFVEGANASF
ncbi:MAG: hypothetical protein QOH41_742 [Blastocatellia bacterium]|jgi:hypothetical protein|nr:hypothetical protein [Blastocatellia bacterium]